MELESLPGPPVGEASGEAEQIEQVLRTLDEYPQGKLPEDALRAAQRLRGLIVPGLIAAIEKAALRARAGQEVESDAAFFAQFLLWEFEAKEALPAILDAVTLPGEGPFELFGDGIHEALPGLLFTLAGDGPELVEGLICDANVNEYVRWSAAQYFCIQVKEGRMPREQAVERLRLAMRYCLDQRDNKAIGFLVSTLTELRPVEARQEIDEAFDRGLVDSLLLRREHADASYHASDEHIAQALSAHRDVHLEDTVKTLSAWAGFREPRGDYQRLGESDSPDAFAADTDRHLTFLDEPLDNVAGTIRREAARVGRNEPCPCGSGKKYKKCCLRAGERSSGFPDG